VTRRPRPEELRLWAIVAATVRPGPGRAPVAPPKRESEAEPPSAAARTPAVVAARKPSAALPIPAPADIEPRRKRRLARERDAIALTLDLHGLDQDRARAALIGFLLRAHDRGERAVLVITGKGILGDGILRRRAPDWLAEPPLRPIVAGWSEAHRRHGGEGALYVALKRKA
jgi:DNA-nicking Smr family endonuclease